MTISEDEAALLRKALSPRNPNHKPRIAQVKAWSGVSEATLYRIWRWDPNHGPWRHHTRATPRSILQRRGAVKILAKTKKRTPLGKWFPAYPSAPAITKALHDAGKGEVHRSTIYRDLTKSGMKCVVRKYIPTADLSKKKSFARSCLTNPTLMRRLVFSDEHTVSVNDHSCRVQYVEREGGKPLGRERKRLHNVTNVQIWAAFGRNWRSPICFLDKDPVPKRPRGRPRKDAAQVDRGATKQKKVPKRCDGDLYIRRCLTTAVCDGIRGGGHVLMQDGAKFHWSKTVQAHLAQQRVEVLRNGTWPAHSPDLNPIENLWALLNRKLADLHPTTLDDLKAKTIQAWNSIPVMTMNKFHASFESKCKAVIANREQDG